MIVLGMGSLMFCYLLYQSKLIPQFIAAWGFIGYAALLIGAVLELFGLNVGLLYSIPGGLFELTLPVWLFVKGFSLSPITSESAETNVNEIKRLSEVREGYLNESNCLPQIWLTRCS